MRVLHVINSLILAGAEALTKELALECTRRGVDVSIAVLKKLDNSFEHELLDAAVPVISLSSRGIYSPLQIPAIARQIRAYDVVQAMLFPATLWTAIAARMFAPPRALITSEQSTHNRRRKPWLRPLDAWMYSHFDAIPCASAAIEQSLQQWVPGTAAKTSVIPNAINVARFREARGLPKFELIGDSDAPLAIFSARFQPQKDHATLLRAIAQVPRIHLLLAGDGPTRPAMQALARSLAIGDRAHFLGRREDVPQLLKACDLYIHSAHFEGFGIAVVEAMAAGIPVIASEVAGLAEVVGDAGLLFPPGDAGRLAALITEVVASPALHQRLSEAGSRRVQEFSIQGAATAYLRLYEEQLRTKKR